MNVVYQTGGAQWVAVYSYNAFGQRSLKLTYDPACGSLQTVSTFYYGASGELTLGADTLRRRLLFKPYTVPHHPTPRLPQAFTLSAAEQPLDKYKTYSLKVPPPNQTPKNQYFQHHLQLHYPHDDNLKSIRDKHRHQ